MDGSAKEMHDRQKVESMLDELQAVTETNRQTTSRTEIKAAQLSGAVLNMDSSFKSHRALIDSSFMETIETTVLDCTAWRQ